MAFLPYRKSSVVYRHSPYETAVLIEEAVCLTRFFIPEKLYGKRF
ncbi:MAG: hypothetical protein ACR2PT_19435 [Endozoicomonas sp.]